MSKQLAAWSNPTDMFFFSPQTRCASCSSFSQLGLNHHIRNWVCKMLYVYFENWCVLYGLSRIQYTLMITLMITHERTQAQLRNVICDASREDLQNHKLGEYVLLGSFLARCNLKLPDKKRAGSSKSAVAPTHLPHEADPAPRGRLHKMALCNVQHPLVCPFTWWMLCPRCS